MESVQETSKEGSILPPLNRKPLSNNNNSSLGTLSISCMRRDSSLFADDTCSWYLTAGLIHQVSAARPMKAVFCSDNLAASKAAADVCASTVLQDRANTRKLLLVLPAETLWRCWLRELSMFGCRMIQILGSGSLTRHCSSALIAGAPSLELRRQWRRDFLVTRGFLGIIPDCSHSHSH